LDLKLHDIPTTVKKAMRNIARLNVDIVNIHASGGREMMQAAKEGLLQGSTSKTQTSLIAVTILTSLTKDVLRRDLSMNGDVSTQVTRLAAVAGESGVDGVVCSAHEAANVKHACGEHFLTVTPGIRLSSSSHDDQQRVATPAFARENKADILVIGRSITNSREPLKAYHQAIKEWQHAAL